MSGATPRRAAPFALILLAVGSAATVGAADLELSWKDHPGDRAQGFQIERRAPGEDLFRVIAVVGPGVVSFLDEGLEPGGHYCYRVRQKGRPDTATESCETAREVPVVLPADDAPPAVAADATEDPLDPRARPGRERTRGGWLQVIEPPEPDQGNSR